MTFQALVVLLPCHSLEDFPFHLDGEQASSLLDAWTTLWHPRLVATAGQRPHWCRADQPPAETAGHLIAVPQASRSLLPADWMQTAVEQGAVVLEPSGKRDASVAAALAPLGEEAVVLDDQIVADFYALGYSYLQVELLTCEMRYHSHLDEVYFTRMLVEAAQYAVAGRHESARQALGACFDALSESRDQFYPVDSYLIDLTLVVPSTMGKSLRDELAGPAPANLLVTGETIEEMARREPATLDVLRKSLATGSASIVGGPFLELPPALTTGEALLTQIQRGQAVYAEHCGRRTKVFAQRQFALSPLLPSMLRQLDFLGALHFTLDGGRTPHSSQSKIRWKGSDGSVIDALARVPRDAAQAEHMLNLARLLSETMDRDHVATIVLAHWPGQTNPWYQDLRRAATQGLALGRFVTLDEYFEKTDTRGSALQFAADQYGWPHLQRVVAGGEASPIAGWIDHTRRDAVDLKTRTLRAWTQLASGRTDDTVGSADTDWTAALASCLTGCRTDRHTVAPAAQSSPTTQWDAAKHAPNLPQDRASSTGQDIGQTRATGASPMTGTSGDVLVINTLGQERIVLVDSTGERLLPEGTPAATREPTYQPTPRLVRVPAAGFARAHLAAETAKRDRPVPLAEDNVLRNDFMTVTVNRTTGAIQALHDYRHRGNLLSAQLAYRFPAGRSGGRDASESRRTAGSGGILENGGDAPYSVMAADDVAITQSTDQLAEITSRGRLLDRQGRRLASYIQRLQLVRHCPVLGVRVELDVAEPPSENPWQSYYAWRVAWADDFAELRRSEMLTSQPVMTERFLAPHFIEIRAQQRLAILSGGLPFHVHSGPRTLDTLLIAGQEQRRSFHLGIGVGLDQPYYAAIELLVPAEVAPTAGAMAADDVPPRNDRGWLFHVGSKHVVATCWEALVGDGAVVGFRTRLLETEGRPASVRLAAFRDVKRVRRTNFCGRTLEELRVDDGRVHVNLHSYEWTQIEAEW